jgi:hypothetical protein
VPDKFHDVASIVKLWRNEATRVYADRLIDATDRTLVTEKLLPDIIRQYFPD